MPRKRPKKLFTLDTETYNGLKGVLKRIAIYDGVDVIYGYTFEDVERVLKSSYKDGYKPIVYIHNLEFDSRKIPIIFERGNIVWGMTKIINGKYATIECMNYTFKDSFKLLPMSLKKLSEGFDIEHGKLDLWDEVQKVYPNEYTDIVDFLDRCHVDDELYLKYLGYDVIALYEVIQKLIDVSGLDIDTFTKCMTTASLSKTIFKYGYKGQPFKAENSDKTDFEILTSNKYWSSHKEIKNNMSIQKVSYIDIENKIRESYFGGRTEVFKPLLKPNGNKIVGYHMDFNSLYPSQMIDNEFPIGVPVFYDKAFVIKQKFEVWQRHKKGLGFIKAKVFIPKCHIPPLPIRIEKLMFPCGYVVGTWTYIELLHAIEKYNVQIIEYYEMIHFPKTYKVFHNYISTFSKLKEKAKEEENNALYTLSKLLMNTSYGWTALRRDDKSELKDITKKDQFEERLIFENEKLGFIEIQSIVMSETIQCQIASYVTSYARLSLLNAFEVLQDMGAEIYYCDTDSIVSNMKLPDYMLHNSKLGLLDVEGELYEAIFLQPKVYYESTVKKENLKFKGVTKQTQKIFDKDFMMNIYKKLCLDVEDRPERIELEKNIDVLRSVRYLQKNNLSYDVFENRDKYLYLRNKQKRQIDYKNNYTEPYFFNSIDEFENFNFKFDLSKFLDVKGNLFNSVL